MQQVRILLCVSAFIGMVCVAAQSQESTAYFDTPRVLLDDDSPPYNRLLDYNNDGFMDAVGHRVNSDGSNMEVIVWQNDGQGSLNPIFTQSGLPFSGPNGGSMSIAVGDLNGDSLQDFVIAGNVGFLQYVSLGNGDFTRQTQTESSFDIHSVVLADFDGDGLDDIALMMTSSSNQPVLKIHWSSGGTLVHPLTLPWQWAEMSVIETDGDSLPDLALWNVSYFYEATIYLLSFAGQTLIEGPSFQTPYLASQGKYAAGDIDGDGDEDIVGFIIDQIGEPKVQVIRRIGPTSWIDEPSASGGPAEFLFDIDSDGDLDGVCCGGGGGGGGQDPTWPMLDFKSTFQVALNDGAGRFDDAFGFEGRGSKELAGIADLDHDGDQDMVAGACVHYSDGPLTQSPTVTAFANGLHDIDRDGDLDAPYPHFLLDHLNVYMNNGNGRFSLKEIPGLEAPEGYYFRSLLEGDFNGDGATDYLTYMIDETDYSFVQMYLIKNNGGGSEFTVVGPAAAPGVQFKIEQYVISYVIEDADGDGDIDVLVRTQSETPRVTEIYLNNGSGYFTFSQALSMKVLALADLDQDGDKDMIGHEGNHLAVSLQANGSYGAQFDPFGPSTPISGIQFVDARDFNDDGYPDFAFPNAIDGASLYFNTTPTIGSVSFQESTVFDGVELYENIWNNLLAEDVNNDGWTDMILGLTRSNTADVYVRKAGTSGVLTRDDYLGPYSIITPFVRTADLDGDGISDLYGREFIRNRTLPKMDGGHREQYGTGDPAMGGIYPTLGASGPFRVGHPAKLMASGCTGGTLALLTVGLGETDLPNMPRAGLTSYNWPWLFFMLSNVGGPAGQEGGGRWVLPYVVMPEVAGLSVYHQLIVLDPEYGLSTTNGLWLHYGQ